MTNALTAKSQRLRRASKMAKMGTSGGISLKAKLGEHLRCSKGIITFYYPLLTRRCSPMSIFGVFEHLRDRQMSIFVAGPWQRVSWAPTKVLTRPSMVLISHEDAHAMSIFGNLVVFIRLFGSKNARKTRRCSPFRITWKMGILHPKTTTLIGPLVKTLGVSARGFLEIAPSLDEGSKFFFYSVRTSFFPEFVGGDGLLVFHIGSGYHPLFPEFCLRSMARGRVRGVSGVSTNALIALAVIH